jgi:aspartate oxidase
MASRKKAAPNGAASILTLARKHGQSVFASRSLLSGLAVGAARCAAEGVIDESDAARIYEAYYNAIIKRGQVQTTDSSKAQVSKLRQIIKLGVAYPKEAEKLLKRVTDVHNALMMEGATVRPLYMCMIQVARCRLDSARALTDAQIKRCVKR